MDDDVTNRARRREGLVPATDPGPHPARTAARAGLELLQPHVYVAATQPIGAATLTAAVAAAVGEAAAFLGATARWLYGAGCPPAVVEVGVPHGTTLRLLPPVRVRRVSSDVLSATRMRRGLRVVDLEMAVIQAAAKRPHRQVVELLEPLLRERRTTIVRLRARCRRGLDGSAAVRRGIDELAGGSMDRAVRSLRRALEVRGVTGLKVEVRFVSAAGAVCYGDLLHEASLTLVEVDGFLSHTERERFRLTGGAIAGCAASTACRRSAWMSTRSGRTSTRSPTSWCCSSTPQCPQPRPTRGDQGRQVIKAGAPWW
jgi:hypothetical protein